MRQIGDVKFSQVSEERGFKYSVPRPSRMCGVRVRGRGYFESVLYVFGMA
jgi:hypothetical protein